MRRHALVAVAASVLACAAVFTLSPAVSALSGTVTIDGFHGKKIQIPADEAKQRCDRYYGTRTSPAGGIQPGFDPDKICPQVDSTPPPTLLQRAAGAAAQGVADTTSNWVVDGATTALGWLHDALTSKKLEPDWGLIAPVYNHMLAFALALVVALIGVTLLERMAGGVQGAGLSIVVRVVYAVGLAVLALPLLAYANGVLEQLSDGWDSAFGHSTSSMVTGLSDQLHHGNAGNGALLAVVALVAMLGALISVGWLVLRVALVQGLAVWLPVAAVLSISPRLAGVLRRLGEFLASIVLAKLVMVITLATGAAFITAGVFDHDWMQVISGTVLLLITATEPFLLLGFLHWMQPYMLGRGHGFAREAVAAGVGSGLGAYEGVRWGIRHVQRFDAERSRDERQHRERGPGAGVVPGSRPRIGDGDPPSDDQSGGGTPPVGAPPRPRPPDVPPPTASSGPSSTAPTKDGENTP